MGKGLFITVEGIDGSGKSTQIGLMKKYLESVGLRVFVTREPGGTEISEQIRSILLDKENKGMEPLTELFLFLASRAQHTKEIVIPHLNTGYVVISDRYADSSVAFQGWGRGIGWKVVEKLNKIATFGVVPDLTIVLDISPELGQERLSLVQGKLFKDRLEGEKFEFHKLVREGYLDLAKRHKSRVKVVDGKESVENVWAKIKSHIDELLYRKRRMKIK